MLLVYLLRQNRTLFYVKDVQVTPTKGRRYCSELHDVLTKSQTDDDFSAFAKLDLYLLFCGVSMETISVYRPALYRQIVVY